jgi:hypothetical protein
LSRRSRPLILAAAALVAAVACGKRDPLPSEGKIEGYCYNNAFFSLNYCFPGRWEADIHPPAGSKFVESYLRLLAAGTTKEDSGEILRLLRVSSLPLELMGSKDAMVTISAANIKNNPNIVTQRRAVSMGKTLLSIPLSGKVTVVQPFKKERFGGRDWDAAVFTVKLKDAEIHSKVYVRSYGYYAMIVEVFGKSEAGLKEGEHGLLGLSFY